MKTAISRRKVDEVALLKSQLKSAKSQIRHLRREILQGRTRLDPVERELLREIAEAHIDDAYIVTFAMNLELSKAKLEFHLCRLLKRGYIEVRFIDPEFDENYAITQKGRTALFGSIPH